jgi:cysteine desulfuration protein SufE
LGDYLSRLKGPEFFVVSDRLQSVKEDFVLLDDWEERYRYVIDLGRTLEPMPEALKTPATKVRGCASQVWIVARSITKDGREVIHFIGDSDALIVKGLIALVFMLYSDRSPREIAAEDARVLLADLGLKDHLTPQRSNGLVAMINRIREEARAAVSDQ